MNWKITKVELWVLLILTVLFPFLTTNFNSNLGLTYSIFCLSAIVYIILDPQRDIPFKKENDSFLTSVLWAGVAVVVFILMSNYLIIPGTKALMNLLASSTPVLASNPLTNKITFGILVAASETLFFFVYGFDLICSLVGVKISPENLKKFKLWFVIFGISLAFMVFHLTAKASGNAVETVSTLTVVFFMAIFSLLLVVFRKEALSSILFHILLNSLSVGLIALS